MFVSLFVRSRVAATLSFMLLAASALSARADEPLVEDEPLLYFSLGANGYLLRFDPVTFQYRVVPPLLEFVSFGDLVAASADKIYLTTGYGIYEMDVVNETATAVAPSLYATGLAIDTNGNLLAYSQTDIVRVEVATGAQTIVSAGGHLSAGSLVVTDDGTIYATGRDPSAAPDIVVEILSIDPATGMQTVIASSADPNSLVGSAWITDLELANDGTGELVLSQLAGQAQVPPLVRLDPATGAQTTYPDYVGAVGGLSFLQPYSMGLKANGNVVVGNHLLELVEVDAQTGAGTLIFNEAAGLPIVETVRLPACDDGIDNDGDGRIDAAFIHGDFGCTSAQDRSELPECADGFDNDYDGETDLADTDCRDANDPTERTRACSDGIDNDGNGDIDLDDPQCDGNPEKNRETPGCGSSISPIAELNGVGLAALLLLLAWVRPHPRRR